MILKRPIALLAALTAATAADAHQPWVLPADARIDAGQSTEVGVYFGHAFPVADFMDVERIAAARTVGPSGAVEAVAVGERVPFDSPVLTTPGTHVIGVEQARGYWTQTPDGGRPHSRSELEEAVHCTYSGNAAKTLVRVGDSDASAVGRALGHRLEILPESDPTDLVAGDALPVRVRFDGEPHAGPLMAFHADSGEAPYRTTETDADGRATIELTGAGPWMLVARAERPYPDPSECDIEGFHASLTFSGGD